MKKALHLQGLFYFIDHQLMVLSESSHLWLGSEYGFTDGIIQAK